MTDPSAPSRRDLFAFSCALLAALAIGLATIAAIVSTASTGSGLLLFFLTTLYPSLCVVGIACSRARFRYFCIGALPPCVLAAVAAIVLWLSLMPEREFGISNPLRLHFLSSLHEAALFTVKMLWGFALGCGAACVLVFELPSKGRAVTAAPGAFRFGLKSLLVFTAVAAVGLAWYVAVVRPRQKTVDAIVSAGGWLRYKTVYGEENVTPSDPSHAWLDFLATPWEAYFTGEADNDDVCSKIARLTTLRAVSVGTNVSDLGLKRLCTLPQLRSLHLKSTAITDAGLAELARLPELEQLFLSQTKVSDRCFESLHACKRLKSLSLSKTNTTEAAVKKFSEDRPDCWIRMPDGRELGPPPGDDPY